MSIPLFKLLDEQVERRKWDAEREELDEMCGLYEGDMPKRYEEFFPTKSPTLFTQLIPLAWDDLATQVGRLPDLRGVPRDHTNREEKAAGLLERIGFYYLRCAAPTGKLFMKDLAWWLQLGRSVAIVTPDWEKQMPRFELRDPRTCYPGVAESVNNRITKLSDLIFKYELSIHEARERGLAPEPEVYTDPTDSRQARVRSEKTHPDMVKVIEYIDDMKWCIVSEFGLSVEADHNLGMVPGYVFGTFTPSKKAGHNRFRDQVTLQIGVARLLSAKMAFADRVTSSTIWTRNFEGILEMGPDTIIKLGPQGEIGQIGPPQTLQVDQDIQMLNQFSRILNRNPEVRQGEIAAKGTYTSAKTLEQLSESIDTVVGADWDVLGPGMEYLFAVCFEMDVRLWGDVEKTVEGNLRGERYLDTYTPNKDIGDRRAIRVEYGFGVGGYQGFLMHLQAKDAGVMSKRRAMEAMPGISDVAAEERLMELEAMDEAGKALILQQAATGTLDLRLLAKIRKQMAEKGTPLLEAVEKMQDELAAQAQAAMAAEQSSLTAPMPGEEMMEAGPPELPGIPPAVMAGV